MLHDASPIELQDVHHSSWWSICYILAEVHISRVIVESRMKDREVCGRDEACKTIKARVRPAGRCVRIVLDVGVVEVIRECSLDVFVNVELADELVEDVCLFFRLGGFGRAEALC